MKLLDRKQREAEGGQLTDDIFNQAMHRSFGGMLEANMMSVVGQSLTLTLTLIGGRHDVGCGSLILDELPISSSIL